MRSTIPILGFLALAFFTSDAHASTIGLTVSNVEDPSTDFLFADSSGVLLPSGIATMGYFPGGFSVSTSLNISVLIDNFTVAASGLIGNSIALGPIPGHVYSDQVSIDDSGLSGRPLYGFIGNGSTLSNSTEVGLYQIATIQTGAAYFLRDRDGSPAVLGTFGGKTTPIDLGFGLGAFEHHTFKLVAVPEASIALLGAIGCISLLGRRRA